MSLFPDEDILTKEIESWKGFADSLKSEEDKNLFLKMLNIWSTTPKYNQNISLPAVYPCKKTLGLTFL